MGLSFFTDLASCAGLRGADYDACMIRNGFQKTGPTSYTRSTGAQPGDVAKAALPLVPVLGDVYGAVAGAVGAVRTPSVTPLSLQSPQPAGFAAAVPVSAAPSPVSSAGAARFDSQTIVLASVAAIVLLLFLRR